MLVHQRVAANIKNIKHVIFFCVTFPIPEQMVVLKDFSRNRYSKNMQNLCKDLLGKVFSTTSPTLSALFVPVFLAGQTSCRIYII